MLTIEPEEILILPDCRFPWGMSLKQFVGVFWLPSGKDPLVWVVPQRRSSLSNLPMVGRADSNTLGEHTGNHSPPLRSGLSNHPFRWQQKIPPIPKIRTLPLLEFHAPASGFNHHCLKKAGWFNMQLRVLPTTVLMFVARQRARLAIFRGHCDQRFRARARCGKRFWDAKHHEAAD